MDGNIQVDWGWWLSLTPAQQAQVLNQPQNQPQTTFMMGQHQQYQNFTPTSNNGYGNQGSQANNFVQHSPHAVYQHQQQFATTPAAPVHANMAPILSPQPGYGGGWGNVGGWTGGNIGGLAGYGYGSYNAQTGAPTPPQSTSPASMLSSSSSSSSSSLVTSRPDSPAENKRKHDKRQKGQPQPQPIKTMTTTPTTTTTAFPPSPPISRPTSTTGTRPPISRGTSIAMTPPPSPTSAAASPRRPKKHAATKIQTPDRNVPCLDCGEGWFKNDGGRSRHMKWCPAKQQQQQQQQ